MNELAQQGYRVNTFNTAYAPSDIGGMGESKLFVLMSLKSEAKYDDITNLKDVSPEEVDSYLAEGWIVADAWSKSVRMVYKGDIHEECPDCDGCERLTVEEAYEHVMDNPPERGI